MHLQFLQWYFCLPLDLLPLRTILLLPQFLHIYFDFTVNYEISDALSARFQIRDNRFFRHPEVIDLVRVYRDSISEIAEGIGEEEFYPTHYGDEIDTLIGNLKVVSKFIYAQAIQWFVMQTSVLATRNRKTRRKDKISRKLLDRLLPLLPEECQDLVEHPNESSSTLVHHIFQGAINASLQTYVERSIQYVDGGGEDKLERIAQVEQGLVGIDEIQNIKPYLKPSGGVHPIDQAKREIFEELSEGQYEQKVMSLISDILDPGRFYTL